MGTACRVRSGDLSINITGSKTFTALGNITSGVLRVNNNPLPAPWAALNVIGQENTPCACSS